MLLSFIPSNVIPGFMTMQQLPYYVDQPECQLNLAFLDFNLAAEADSLPVDLLKNQPILIAMLLCVSTKNTTQSCKTLNVLVLYAVKWSCPL